jgi:hypothetical protein
MKTQRVWIQDQWALEQTAKAQKSGLDSNGVPTRTLYRHDNGANRRAKANKQTEMGYVSEEAGAMKVIAAVENDGW